jgi:hypothetical protein
MAETWYARDSAAPLACGPGTRKNLSETVGSSTKALRLDGTGDTWNKAESRTIAAGDWRVAMVLDTDSGGGPQNRVNVLVQRVNSSCTVQGSDIINETIDVTKGDSGKTYFTTLPNDPGEITFAAGDGVLVTFTDTNGNQWKDVKYDGGVGGNTSLVHPDEATGPELQDVGDATVSPTGALATVFTQAQAVGGATASPTGGVSKKVFWPEFGAGPPPTPFILNPTGSLGTVYRQAQAVGGHTVLNSFGTVVKKTSKTAGGATVSPTGDLTPVKLGIAEQATGGFTMAPVASLMTTFEQNKSVGGYTVLVSGALSTALIQAEAVGGFTVAPTGALTTHKWHGAYGRPMYLLDPTLYDPAAVIEFEAVLKTDAGTARARLWNITDGIPVPGSEVTATETTFTRKRSAALTLPAAAKEYQAQLGNDEGNTTTGDGAGLIVRQGTPS